MAHIFVSGIPKGLNPGSVSRIIEQGIETVAQVKNISVHPNKGYAFVDLHTGSSDDIVLTLNKKIEVNSVALVLQRSKIGRRGHQKSNKQVKIPLNRKFQHQNLSYNYGNAGFRTYAEYQRDRPKTEPVEVAFLSRKRKQIKPWKKIKMQSPLPSQNPGVTTTAGRCFERHKKRNYHYISSKCPSPKTSAKRRRISENTHMGVSSEFLSDCVGNCLMKSISFKTMNNLQDLTSTENYKTSSKALSDSTRLQQHSQRSHGVTNKAEGHFVKAYVYHSSKYLFDIDVDNKNVFESVSAAIFRKYTVPGDSLLFCYDGKLINKENQPTIANDGNIHITVKGVGGMNRDDFPPNMESKPEMASQTDEEEGIESFRKLIRSFEDRVPTPEPQLLDCTQKVVPRICIERDETDVGTRLTSHPKSGTEECLDSYEQKAKEVDVDFSDLETEMARYERTLAKRRSKYTENTEKAEPHKKESDQLTKENEKEPDRSLSNVAQIYHKNEKKSYEQKEDLTLKNDEDGNKAFKNLIRNFERDPEPQENRKSDSNIDRSSYMLHPTHCSDGKGVADVNQDGFQHLTREQLRHAQVHTSDSATQGEVKRKIRVSEIRRSFEQPHIAQPVSISDSPTDLYGDSQTPNYKNVMLEDELRIALIGKTGSGKSATCNTILGINAFESRASARSVTFRCQSAQASRFGRMIYIVDTPGTCDTAVTKKDTVEEVGRLVSMTIPGPHAIVLIVAIGRFTEEEKQAISDLSKLFGKEMYKYLIVVFTRLDDLEDDKDNLPRYIEESPHALQKLLKKCDNRYIGFNNRASPDIREEQAKSLIDMINKCNSDNGGSHYSNDMYQTAMKEFEKTKSKSQTKEKEPVRKMKDENFRRELEDNLRKKQELEEEKQRLKRQKKESKDRAERTHNELIKLQNEKTRHSKLMEESERKDEEEFCNTKELLEKAEAKLSERRSENYEKVNLLRKKLEILITKQNEKKEEENKIKQNYEERQKLLLRTQKEFEVAILEQEELYQEFVQDSRKREQQIEGQLIRIIEQNKKEHEEILEFRKKIEKDSVKRTPVCSIL